MSASPYLPQRHLNLIPNPAPQETQFSVRPSITERFSQLLREIESFLLACSHEEMRKFWHAISELRHGLQNCAVSSEVPQFLTGRRKQRDFCRILEVLADLPYPKMHLSNHLAPNSGHRDRMASQPNQLHQSQLRERGVFAYPYLAVQR